MISKSKVNQGKKRILDRSITTRELIFLVCLVLCLSPIISPPVALLLGIVIAQFVGHPYLHLNHKFTHILLQASVVGLGFGMPLDSVLQASRDGVFLTVISIISVLVLGYFLGRILKVNKNITFLISVGTAICGGSAIAAVSPILKAEERQISVAIGTIFMLNSLALFIFPFIGHILHLSQMQFGLWCAIGIHDTSSVVGAASKYGNEALQIATTVKLARALWIIPVACISSLMVKSKGVKIKIPYFIGLFILAVLLSYYVPFFQRIDTYIVSISKAGMTLTLFLIGAGLSRKALASVGFKPILLGIILWVLIAIPMLLVILNL